MASSIAELYGVSLCFVSLPIDVNEMKAETKRPKNKATTTNDVKSGQNGNANKQTPLRIRDMFVTTSEDTHGRSTKVKTIWFHKDIPGTTQYSPIQ